ncbi:hypothetical protein TCON_0631 [Astathelohania contejeani]|uniref:Uncharacterized protein n=1 Tax=Astathelohania contejeani TaxID=164912 RepID=A0ABQ7I169_9MICR|nr:hypothetical protein TCON_0631 [Thelohania contejeani]
MIAITTFLLILLVDIKASDIWHNFKPRTIQKKVSFDDRRKSLSADDIENLEIIIKKRFRYNESQKFIYQKKTFKAHEVIDIKNAILNLYNSGIADYNVKDIWRHLSIFLSLLFTNDYDILTNLEITIQNLVINERSCKNHHLCNNNSFSKEIMPYIKNTLNYFYTIYFNISDKNRVTKNKFFNKLKKNNALKYREKVLITKNEGILIKRINIFLTICSLHFYLFSNSVFCDNASLLQYLFLLSCTPCDTDFFSIVRLYEIGGIARKCHNNFKNERFLYPFIDIPFYLIIVINSVPLSGEFLMAFSESILHNNSGCDTTNILKFYIVNEDINDLFLSYFNEPSESAFFNNFLDHIFKYQVFNSSNELIQLLMARKNLNTISCFMDNLLHKSMSLLQSEDVTLCEMINNMWFICSIINDSEDFFKINNITHSSSDVSYKINVCIKLDKDLNVYYKNRLINLLCQYEKEFIELLDFSLKRCKRKEFKNLAYLIILIQLRVKYVRSDMYKNISYDILNWFDCIMFDRTFDKIYEKAFDMLIFHYKLLLVNSNNKILKYINIEHYSNNIFEESKNNIKEIIRNTSAETVNGTRFDCKLYKLDDALYENWLLAISNEFIKGEISILECCDTENNLYTPCLFDDMALNGKGGEDLVYLGWIIGLAILRPINFHIKFSKLVYDMILNKKPNPEDLIKSKNIFKSLFNTDIESDNALISNNSIDCISVNDGKYVHLYFNLSKINSKITEKNISKYKTECLEYFYDRMKKSVDKIRCGITDIISENSLDSIKISYLLKCLLSNDH